MNAQLPITEDANVAQLPAIRRPTEVRVVEDTIPVLDTARFEHMQRIAMAMARCSLIPKTLRDKDDVTTAANCFLVVNQAVQWNMDPFQVAQCVSVINGRLMHEGKLIAAVIEAKLGIKLHKEWRGQGEQMSIVVSNPRDTTECVTGSVAEWKTTREGSPWIPKQYAKMLWYRGVREWCRMYAPGLILGIYSPDEAWDDPDAPHDLAIEPPTPPEPPAIEAPKIENHAGEAMHQGPAEVTADGTDRASASGRGQPAPDTKPTPSPTPKMEQGMVDALGGPIPPSDDVPVPPGLRRAKGPPPFKLDAWMATLKKECEDKTPAQLLDMRVKMVEPLKERLGHDGYNKAGDILGAAMEAAQKKYAPAPALDGDQWLNDLSGAISGCTTMDQVVEIKKKVQKPAKGKVSDVHYGKGERLVEAALMQLADED